jgi:hypothetical protein
MARTGGVLGLCMLLSGIGRGRAAETTEGLALMIVYDTSGSMQQKVRDADGRLTPKRVIASRALTAVIDRLRAVRTGSGGNGTVIDAGMVVFEGDHAAVAVKFRPFDPQPFRDWLAHHGNLTRGTPLGDAVRLAGESVLGSKLPRKHVLIITDGINTRGPDPKVTLPEVQREAERNHTAVSFHFVAFDVNAAEFNAVKKLGATVVAAADEKQLDTQVQFILEKKILLEDEEPATTKPPGK